MEPTTEHTWEVYSASGRMIHRTSNEEIARYGLATWPQAKTLVCDGELVDENRQEQGLPGPGKPR